METVRLSDLAEAILEDKWILCTPAECLSAAIGEYLDHAERGRPYLFGDPEHPVAPLDFIRAIGELVEHFASTHDTFDGYA